VVDFENFTNQYKMVSGELEEERLLSGNNSLLKPPQDNVS